MDSAWFVETAKVLFGACVGFLVSWLLFRFRVKEDYKRLLFEKKVQAISEINQNTSGLFTLAAQAEFGVSNTSITKDCSRLVAETLLVIQKNAVFLSPDSYDCLVSFVEDISLNFHDPKKEPSFPTNSNQNMKQNEWRNHYNRYFNIVRKELGLKLLRNPPGHVLG